MVEKALNRIKKTDVDEVVEFQWNISDFENIENISTLLRQGDYKRTFTLLLGNTPQGIHQGFVAEDPQTTILHIQKQYITS